jgi:hypothetical protein
MPSSGMWRRFKQDLHGVTFQKTAFFKNIVIILLIYIGAFRNFGVSELFKTKFTLKQV